MLDFNITANFNNPAIEAAVQYLAGLDSDHATIQNGVGFNGRDTEFGCSVAKQSQTKRLSDKQHHTICKILWRYNNNQLKPAGYALPTTGELDVWLKQREIQYPYTPAVQQLPTATTPPASMGAVTILHNALSVTMPHPYYQWVTAIKTLQVQGHTVARYHKEENNRWSVPMDWASELIKILPASHFVYDPAILQTQAEKEKQQTILAAEREIQQAKRQIEVRKLMRAAKLDQPLLNGWYLHEYQREAVEFVFKHERVLIGDDLGLGKTIESLKAAAAYQQVYGADIICIVPLSTMSNWEREASVVGCRIQVVGQTAGRIPDPATITKPFVLIADEAHCFKNLQSQRTKKWLALCESPHLVCNIAMSATPVKNGSPSDVFALLKGLKHDLGKSKAAFEARYGSVHQGYLRELHQILTVEKPVMIRRRAKDVLQLPPFSRQMVEGELSSMAQEVYNTAFAEMQRQYRERIADGDISSMGWELVILNHLRHAGSIAKIETTLQMVLDLVQGVDGEAGEQVVVFTTFKDTAYKLRDLITANGYTVGLLTGDTAQAARQPMFDKFQSKQLDVMVCMAQAGGVGINLFSASKVILHDRDWNINSQLEGRVYRQGQQNSVTSLWVQHTKIDHWIDGKLLTKAETSDLIIEGYSVGLEGVSWDEEARNLLADVFSGRYSMPTVDVEADEIDDDYLPQYGEEF